MTKKNAVLAAHKTAIERVAWDGPLAMVEAPNNARVLEHMHVLRLAEGEADAKTSYKFPHHMPGENTPANLLAVNNALARLANEDLPASEKLSVARHLRAHRKDAGLSEALSAEEISAAVARIKHVDDLKKNEASALQESIRLQENATVATWFEAQAADSGQDLANQMYGQGRINRAEYKGMLAAWSSALDVFVSLLQGSLPDLFTRAPWEDCPMEPDGDEADGEATEPVSEAILGDFVPLVEALASDGTVPVKLIKPGWGSSGYYSPEVLQRDGPKVFPSGTKMFWNHPSLSEESDRPERNLNDLAAVLTSPAKYQAQGPTGPGLYAQAKVFDTYREAVGSLAPHIGLSIRAGGKAMAGNAEGRNGPIITALTPDQQNTVDFVTYPGAGGEVLSLFEAARVFRAGQKSPAGVVPAGSATSVAVTESNMEDEVDVKELQEKVAALEADKGRLQEALTLRDARDFVREALGDINLPDATRRRLVDALPMKAPAKDGALDKDAFGRLVKESVKAEVKYLAEATGMGAIRGLGGDGNLEDNGDEQPEKVEEALEAAFAEFGLSEKAAKLAAKGR